jgi:photosystem II stability/assembly factor-like uncharacterized protein
MILVGGTATLLKSEDGGGTFRSVRCDPPITYSWIYDIARRGTIGYVAVGKDGSIYFADSKGDEWRKVNY